MVCDEKGVGGSTEPLEASNLGTEERCNGAPCATGTLMMLIATVVSEAGRCILAISLQGKLLLTSSMGQKRAQYLRKSFIPHRSRYLNGVASGRPFAVRIHATSSGRLLMMSKLLLGTMCTRGKGSVAVSTSPSPWGWFCAVASV